MKVETVEMLKHVKAGKDHFPKGRVYTEPIPESVMAEVKAGADTVRVLTTSQTSKTEEAADPAAAPQTSTLPETEKAEQAVSGDQKTENEKDEKDEETFCEACGAGPFKGNKGLRMHRMNCVGFQGQE